MFERLANGWDLAKQSFGVLKLDRELLLFPLLSGIACLAVMASFGLPLWATGQFEELLAEDQAYENPVIYLLLFLYYFANYFVIVFFNSALIACAIIRFNGGNPTLGDGLRAASSRLPQIAGWALVSATVSTILKLIESRSEKLGQIVAALLGTAWSVGTYFVVPVLVVEKVGPVEAVKRSVSVLKKSWGEALAANFGIGLIVGLLSFLACIPGFFGVYAGVNGNLPIAVICIATSVVALIVISLVSSAVNTIVIGALYIYAAEGRIPDQFDESALVGAFRR